MSMQLCETDRAILQSYHSVVDGLAEFWGQGIEIVLYSLEDYDKAAVKVVNGHYTGRKEGAPLTDLALSMLRQIQHSAWDDHRPALHQFLSGHSSAPVF